MGIAGDDDLSALVTAVVETGAQGPAGHGRLMKAVQGKVAGRAEGGRVAAEVRRQLSA